MEGRSRKNIRASTGFKPVTSVIPVQCSTNWAMKPHMFCEAIHQTGFSGKCSCVLFPLKIFIPLCFNVLSTVPHENRLADSLYIYIYIYIYIYLLKTAFAAFSIFIGHRLSVHTPAVPIIWSRNSHQHHHKMSWKHVCSSEKKWQREAILDWNKINMEELMILGFLLKVIILLGLAGHKMNLTLCASLVVYHFISSSPW